MVVVVGLITPEHFDLAVVAELVKKAIQTDNLLEETA
jgi:hypothetical protein